MEMKRFTNFSVCPISFCQSNFRTHKWFEAEHNFYLFNTVQRLQHCHDLEANATKEWHVGNIIPLLKVIYF
ncbi:hypothetical protein T01_14956 [Trichinella spiralis]|uniref:Uncharacterized protein n=1 Tax=Trichinella spiralis TaxID=6334 RepID=A0A0V1BSC7_TRISP|nr:hypothetical protein T01_14956 [Trichinella spiralis]